MYPQPAICGATMRPNVSTRMHYAKFRLAPSAQFRIGYGIDYFAGYRAFFAVFRMFVPSGKQLELFPIAGVF